VEKNIEDVEKSAEKSQEYKIISEQKRTILVEKPDGKRVYVCKLCGEEIGDLTRMAKHFTAKHRKDETATEEIRIEPPERKKILTPEEEMLEEMCSALKTQMEATPGIGVSPKTEWFVNMYFRNNPILQENPQELFKALRRNFPRADDDAISWIVSAVFKVREQYSKSVSTFLSQPDFTQQFKPINLPSPTASDGMVSLIIAMMQQMMNQQQQFYNMLIHEIKNKPNPEAIRAQVENEFLRRHLERLEDQFSKMTELISESRSRGVSPEGWRDDYARLIAEMGDKVLSLGERIIIENKKFRQTLIKYLAPKIFKEEKEIAPSGSGRTDEEILRELEEEGLVE